MHQADSGRHPGHPLAQRLADIFAGAQARRQSTEERWLKDLRQYKGAYDPDISSRLHPRRSRAFLRLTRAKVRLADARLMDLLFSGGGDDNWSIRPTPVPETMPGTAHGAEQACAAMQREMRDQLTECRYREVVRDVIHSGNLYGTGVLKGPLLETRTDMAWSKGPGGWESSAKTRLRPFLEFVPVWDVYPDVSANSVRNARYLFQRHVMNAFELRQLAQRPDFDETAISEHLRDHPGGDARMPGHEQELASLGGNGAERFDCGGKHQVLEFWGYLPGRELSQAGVPVDLQQMDWELPATAWVLGQRIIKAAPAPLSGTGWPYHFYYFDKDETGVFGEGLASIMRDPQQLFNASVRALLDNAAIAAGPQLEVNQDLLPEHEDVTDVHPFRVWLRSGRGADAAAPAVRVTSLPSHTEEFMAMARLFEGYAHETTGIPSAMHAELEGASRTAKGLSMMLSATSVPLRDQVKHFDDGITRPFITALYHWNMLFGDREETKGDFRVDARGWSSLVARELAVEQLDAFAASVANPLDAPYVRRGELLKRRAMARGLGEDILAEPPTNLSAGPSAKPSFRASPKTSAKRATPSGTPE